MSENRSFGMKKKGAYLVINSQIFPLNKGVVRIGRKLDNDLVIQESMVSRYHAEIRYQDNRYHIFDLDSTSGSYLNQKKIESGVLYSGDIILLANVPLMFIDDSADLTVSSEDATGQLRRNE